MEKGVLGFEDLAKLLFALFVLVALIYIAYNFRDRIIELIRGIKFF